MTPGRSGMPVAGGAGRDTPRSRRAIDPLGSPARVWVMPVPLLLLVLTAGCAILDGETLGAGAAGSSGGAYPWLDDPEAYAQAIADGDASRRTREREQAVAYLLRDPRAESALRLQLVFAAGVQSIDEAYEAAAQLDAAAAQVRSPFARAALSSVALATQRYQQALRQGVETQNLLNVERGQVARVEEERQRLAAEVRRLRQALDDVQGKLRALMSIEEQLQDNT